MKPYSYFTAIMDQSTVYCHFNVRTKVLSFLVHHAALFLANVLKRRDAIFSRLYKDISSKDKAMLGKKLSIRAETISTP